MSLTMTFQAKDDPNDANNIINEFYTHVPKLATLEVSQEHVM